MEIILLKLFNSLVWSCLFFPVNTGYLLSRLIFKNIEVKMLTWKCKIYIWWYLWFTFLLFHIMKYLSHTLFLNILSLTIMQTTKTSYSFSMTFSKKIYLQKNKSNKQTQKDQFSEHNNDWKTSNLTTLYLQGAFDKLEKPLQRSLFHVFPISFAETMLPTLRI